MNEKSPIPTNAQKAKVHAFAEDVARRVGFSVGDPIEPLVAKLGGRIEYRNAVGFESRLPESIIVESTRRFTIFVPTMTSRERDRFTIAHELGHFFLHYPLVVAKFPGATMVATRWVDETDAVQQRAEWEANWFAAAFLMPEADFLKVYSAKGQELMVTAAHFGVSTPAAEVRARSLGLI